MAQSLSTSEKASFVSSTVPNVTEWTNIEVQRFIQQTLPKKYPIDVAKSVQRHALTGLDLLDLNDHNLQELGVSTIHERKNILRAIKQLKENSSQSAYSMVTVKMLDSSQQGEKRLQLRVCLSSSKVKHILRQAFQAFTSKKCDLSQYCLVQSIQSGIPKQNTIQTQKVPLLNSTLLSEIPNSSAEFEICKLQEFISFSHCPSSISSPIRVLRPNVDNSLERIITSPIETIYVQPTGDDNEEIVQMVGQSIDTLQSQRQTQRPSTATKSVSQAMLKKSKGPTNNSSSNASTNRESNQSGPTNYLQNYITTNKLSNKKSFNQLHQQSHGSSQLVPAFSQFQIKKHSVNETVMNYTNPISQVTTNPSSFNNTQAPSGQNMAIGSLSRGNSIKKMKTMNGNQGAKPIQSQVHNLSSQQTQFSLNQHSLSNNSKTKKIASQKNQKSLNMYQTLNGNSQAQVAISNNKVKATVVPIKLEANRIDTQQTSDYINEDCFVRTFVNDGADSHRVQSTPKEQRHHVVVDQGYKSGGQPNGKKSNGSFKQSFVHAYNQQQQHLPLFKQGSKESSSKDNSSKEQRQINNLNEIFSDFLDEQQIHGSTSQKKTINPKGRAESQHSRQQALLEEDSLESTKRKLQPNSQQQQIPHSQVSLNIPTTIHANFNDRPSNLPLYEKTNQIQLNHFERGQNIASSESLQQQHHSEERNGLTQSQLQSQAQRAVKHMQHKSMYTLNSNQVKSKKQQYVTNSHTKNANNLQQHFGTFDNTTANYEFQHTMNTMNTMHEGCLQYDDQVFNENYNITNIYFNPSAQKSSNGTARVHTEVDCGVNSVLGDDKENYAAYKGKGNKQMDVLETNNGLGRRGGTLQTTNKAYGRSDSNPTKHKNNRYSDQCDDLMMMDMSEEESLIIKHRF